MNSIESLKLDFNSQIDDLGNIHNEKIFEECIYRWIRRLFCCWTYCRVSNSKMQMLQPFGFINSRLLEGKTYCFISVTGKTRANIKLARRAKKSGLNTVAVTANENSKLAQVCDHAVPLNITKSENTNGRISYLCCKCDHLFAITRHKSTKQI